MLTSTIRTLIEQALAAAQAAGELPPAGLPDPRIEPPPRADQGDFATPIALSLAKPMRRPPREIAAAIVRHLPASDAVASVEIAGAGYLNLRLDPAWVAREVDRILRDGSGYAHTNLGHGRRVNVEFVSANPTGPLTVGHGRNAAIGDTLANVLAATGYEVTREYYYNDGGLQMRVLGTSLRLRVLQLLDEELEFPEDHYQGAYLVDIARELVAAHGPELAGRDLGFFTDAAQQAIFAGIRATLDRLGVGFDVYTNEATLYQSGAIWNVLDRLRSAGYAYDADGAVWFRATTFGADKDRVLVRSTGEPTYRLPDIAYHVDKLDRGFDLLITVLGSDHIAEMPDIKSALQILGYPAERVEPCFYQFVTLVRDGVTVKMSTRRANFVTLDELIDEVGSDAVRFFLLMRSAGTPMEFDLNLAKAQSDENPVYYVQYAHARAMGILERSAPERGIAFDPEADVTLLTHPSEQALIKECLRLADVLVHCAESRELYALTHYSRTLAGAFNAFYRDCPVLAAPDRALVASRMKLVRAAQISMARALQILGVTAVAQM
jgi:arginyl-tRNA synthetase